MGLGDQRESLHCSVERIYSRMCAKGDRPNGICDVDLNGCVTIAFTNRKAFRTTETRTPALRKFVPDRNMNDRLPPGMDFRWDVIPSDADSIEELVRQTGFFDADEVLIARELVEERLARGPASGYEFLIVTQSHAVAGYTCFGHIACTKNAWDLYWIAVAPSFQRQGLGSWLAHATEREVHCRGGRGIYIDTSGRDQYRSTRQFYERCGYSIAANFPDFYDLNDPKLVYAKRLKNAHNSDQASG